MRIAAQEISLNRTTVECKYIGMDFREFWEISLNRTTVECKYRKNFNYRYKYI